MGTHEKLDYAARWLRDGLQEAARAGAFESIDVDVTEAQKTLQRLKVHDRKVTWTHLFIRAASLVLARNPQLHQLIAGNRKIHPDSVDICLSIDGDECVTPVVIIEDAANKDVFAIAAEVTRRAPQVVEESRRLFAALRRWGWILPLSVLRRGLLGFLLRRIWYRRKISGTFQISCVAQVDVFAPMIFNTAAVLGIGRVRDRVVARNGVPTVRPVVTLTCCLDHSVWNGMACARFLTALRDIVESADFAEASVDARQTQPAAVA
jgi:pyruvate/2-oxoglutarate dehydrogenase complex dihydrolipoamide acyltransferase (E2) component